MAPADSDEIAERDKLTKAADLPGGSRAILDTNIFVYRDHT
jgi:hypothetical protein